MEFVIAVTSIFGITGVFWLINRFFGVGVCPICAGVSGTWLWILIGVIVGWLKADSWSLVAALAMGGSVVGIAYQTEKFLRDGASPLLWKTVFVPAGFAVMHSFLSGSWTTAGIALIFLVVFALAFLRLPFSARHGSDTGAEYMLSKNVKKLENEMKNCC